MWLVAAAPCTALPDRPDPQPDATTKPPSENPSCGHTACPKRLALAQSPDRLPYGHKPPTAKGWARRWAASGVVARMRAIARKRPATPALTGNGVPATASADTAERLPCAVPRNAPTTVLPGNESVHRFARFCA